MSRQHAPTVSFPVGRSFILGGVLMAWCVAAGMILAQLVTTSAIWLTPLQARSVAVAAISLICLLLCANLCWRWWHTPTGWLTWEPLVTESSPCLPSTDVATGGWWWMPSQGLQPTAIGTPVVMLAWGAYMGLRLPALQGSRRPMLRRLFGMETPHPGWLWVDMRMQPERWLPLRRALLSTKGM